jgi:hypothetical protein
MASAASSSSASSSSALAPADATAAPAKPSVIITIGMAGAGKSTFVQWLAAHLHARAQPPYVVNLDPAITRAAFEPNIDIRDTVNYQEVMKQCVSRPARASGVGVDGRARRYNLGPNGGILTALNLFTTKFDQVLDIIEKRAGSTECVRACAARVRALTPLQPCHPRHARADRDLHVVGVGGDHHRRDRVVVPHRRRVHHRHAADERACDVHVEHAVRVQVGHVPYPPTSFDHL